MTFNGKCPLCLKAGGESRVYAGASTSTLMYSPPYYDEKGVFHQNDPNTHTTEYTCSKGHSFTVVNGVCTWLGNE